MTRDEQIRQQIKVLVKDIQKRLDNFILLTPTGFNREFATELNIIVSQLLTLLSAEPSEPKICGRCYDEVDMLFPANCEEKPEKLLGQPIGQYHCPDCGAMVLAGLPHPDLCERCLNRNHPAFDKPQKEGEAEKLVKKVELYLQLQTLAVKGELKGAIKPQPYKIIDDVTGYLIDACDLLSHNAKEIEGLKAENKELKERIANFPESYYTQKGLDAHCELRDRNIARLNQALADSQDKQEKMEKFVNYLLKHCILENERKKGTVYTYWTIFKDESEQILGEPLFKEIIGEKNEQNPRKSNL